MTPDITQLAGRIWNREESVFLLIVVADPFDVLLKAGNNFLEPLLVSDLVIEAVLDIRQERKGEPKRILLCQQDRRSCRQIIVCTDAAVLPLICIKEVNL